MTMDSWLVRIRKYIGPVEVVIIFAILCVLAHWLEQREKKQAAEKLVYEMQRYTAESKLLNDKAEGYALPLDADVKVMDSIFQPYVIDSLCRYIDTTCTRGYVTLSKQAPGYERLVVPKRTYYMWVDLKQYFPEGQLVLVTGIAQDDDIIQFHFRIEEQQETLEDMMHKLDSTLQVLQKQKP